MRIYFKQNAGPISNWEGTNKKWDDKSCLHVLKDDEGHWAKTTSKQTLQVLAANNPARIRHVRCVRKRMTQLLPIHELKIEPKPRDCYSISAQLTILL